MKRNIFLAFFASFFVLCVALLSACFPFRPPIATGEPEASKGSSPSKTESPQESFAPLTEDERLNAIKNAKEMNGDTYGWIFIPDTKIDYPVMLGEDNDYYLEHNATRQKSVRGAIFMDYHNAKASQQRNLVLYGHNMKNGAMFNSLLAYQDKSFFESHPDIYLYKGENKIRYYVYAAYVADASKYFHRTEFKSDEAFLEHMHMLKELSEHKPSIKSDLEASDQILTLVTCTYEYDDTRFVVHARRSRESD